jgi:NIPSNAP
MQCQLRMYRVKPGELDDFVDEWRSHVLPLRLAVGFRVLGPWVVADDRFVWLVGHDELDRADAAYYASPERAALDPDPARHLDPIETWLLDER